MARELTQNGRTFNLPPGPTSNLGWVALGGLLISYSRPGDVPDVRIDEYLRVANDSITVVLAASENTTTNSTQRKKVADGLKGKMIVVVADSNPITRGIITAIGWLGVKIKAFRWDDLNGAANESVVPGTNTEEILWALSRLRELVDAKK